MKLLKNWDSHALQFMFFLTPLAFLYSSEMQVSKNPAHQKRDRPAPVCVFEDLLLSYPQLPSRHPHIYPFAFNFWPVIFSLPMFSSVLTCSTMICLSSGSNTAPVLFLLASPSAILGKDPSAAPCRYDVKLLTGLGQWPSIFVALLSTHPARWMVTAVVVVWPNVTNVSGAGTRVHRVYLRYMKGGTHHLQPFYLLQDYGASSFELSHAFQE